MALGQAAGVALPGPPAELGPGWASEPCCPALCRRVVTAFSLSCVLGVANRRGDSGPETSWTRKCM